MFLRKSKEGEGSEDESEDEGESSANEEDGEGREEESEGKGCGDEEGERGHGLNCEMIGMRAQVVRVARRHRVGTITWSEP